MLNAQSPEGIKLLSDWDNAKAQLEKYKTLESELRAEVVTQFTDAAQKKGTENVELANGFVLKVVKKQNVKIDGDKVNDVLDNIEKIGGPEGKLIADRLVKFEPKLSVTEYNQLPEKYKALVDSMVTTSDATPTVEIVAPKSKKTLK